MGARRPPVLLECCESCISWLGEETALAFCIVTYFTQSRHSHCLTKTPARLTGDKMETYLNVQPQKEKLELNLETKKRTVKQFSTRGLLDTKKVCVLQNVFKKLYELC